MNALLLMLVLGQAEAAPKPYIKLAPQVQAEPRALITLEPETNCPELEWEVVTPGAGLVRVPAAKPNAFAAVVIDGGPYQVRALGAVGSKPVLAFTVIAIGPPAPAPPVPPGPPPADLFAAELQQLYAADGSPKKAEHKANIAMLYRKASGFAQTDKTIETVGQLAAKVKAVGDLLVGDGNLIPLRRRIAEETARVIPGGPSAPLSPDVRDKATAYYLRVANVLDTLR